MPVLALADDKYIIPGSWNELTRMQLLRIAGLASHSLPVNEFKSYLLIEVLGLKVRERKPVRIHGELCYALEGRGKLYKLSVLDLAFAAQNSTSFLFATRKKGDQEWMELDSKLTKTLIPDIKISGEIFYGPGDGLHNLIYEEYVRAVVSYADYANTGNPVSLAKLAACLYRKAKKDQSEINGDIREPFNDHQVDARAEIFAGLSQAVLGAIMLQFAGCLWHLSNLFPFPFRGGSGRKPANVFLEQMDIIDSLAKKNIPDKELIRKAPLYDVLHTLNNLIRDSKTN